MDDTVTLALGGKSPAIVDASAGLRRSAELVRWGQFTHAGQACVVPGRVYVHRSVQARPDLARTSGSGPVLPIEPFDALDLTRRL